MAKKASMMKDGYMKSGKAALNPHKADLVVEKKPKLSSPKSQGAEKGNFEEGHSFMDKEASKIKMSREKQKMGAVKSQNYMEGVGAPGDKMAHLPHHNEFSKSNYTDSDHVDAKPISKAPSRKKEKMGY